MPPPSLDPHTHVGTVRLRARDAARLAEWYQEALGLDVLADDGATVALGARPGRPLLVLHGDPGAPARAEGAPGLYHVAFLLPSRASLAGALRLLRAAGWRIDGYADHNVSEALYLRDPEGNGLELYCDRAPEVWRTVDGEIFLTTEPLDVDGLLQAADQPATRLSPRTVIGHVHLSVGDLERAEAFYGGRLGLQVVTRRYPGALFLAAGDYHHHVGCNVWGSRAGARAGDGALGLISFELVVPDPASRRRILDGADEGLVMDPDGHGVRIVRP